MTTIPASNDQHDAPRDYDTGVRSVADTDLPPRSAPFGGDASEAAPGRGRVIFVGTGPGDPELLTLMAVQSLADADAVILDSADLSAILEHPAVHLTPGVVPECLGSREDCKPLTPSNRAKEVLRLANRGLRVVRLVKGDPFMDGNVDFEIVPGVSSLTAVPEYAGIALNNTDGIHFVSATDGSFTRSQSAQWAPTGTLVVNTRVDVVADIAEAAMSSGYRVAPALSTWRHTFFEQRSPF